MAGNYPWGETFQLRLLAYLIMDPEKMYDIVEPSYFSSPVLAEICRVLKENYTSNRNVKIQYATLKELVRPTQGDRDAWPLYKETMKALYEISLPDRAIIFQQAFEFAQENKYREALIQSEKDVTNRNYGRVHTRIDDLRAFGLDPDPGLDFWSELNRHRWDNDRGAIVGSRLKELDKGMGGGLAAGELGIVLAPPKVGKSTVLGNIAMGAMWKHATVAIASGEMADRRYRRRIDAMITGVRTEKLQKKHRKVLKKLRFIQRIMKGTCKIRQFPSGKADISDLESWLDQLEDNDTPADLLIVDYLSLFNPTRGQRERRFSIGQTAVELRGIAVERGIPVWTASQGNRASLGKAIVGPKDFAEDISQFWTLDFLWACCQTEHEESRNRFRIMLAARDFASGLIDKCEMDRPTYRVIETDWGSSSSSDDKKRKHKEKDLEPEPPDPDDEAEQGARGAKVSSDEKRKR